MAMTAPNQIPPLWPQLFVVVFVLFELINCNVYLPLLTPSEIPTRGRYVLFGNPRIYSYYSTGSLLSTLYVLR